MQECFPKNLENIGASEGRGVAKSARDARTEAVRLGTEDGTVCSRNARCAFPSCSRPILALKLRRAAMRALGSHMSRRAKIGFGLFLVCAAAWALAASPQSASRLPIFLRFIFILWFSWFVLFILI